MLTWIETLEGEIMKSFLKDTSGATAIEYGLIAAAMGVMLIVTMPYLANSIGTQFNSLGQHITSGK
jgi:pilus assembly protein Flp/PilA